MPIQVINVKRYGMRYKSTPAVTAPALAMFLVVIAHTCPEDNVHKSFYYHN